MYLLISPCCLIKAKEFRTFKIYPMPHLKVYFIYFLIALQFRLSIEWWLQVFFFFTDKESDLGLPHTSVADVSGSAQSAPGGLLSKPAVEGSKTDKMEETLTCVICQDLLHDCIRWDLEAFVLQRATYCAQVVSQLLMLRLCVCVKACSLACMFSVLPATPVGWSAPVFAPPVAAPWREFVKTIFSTT